MSKLANSDEKRKEIEKRLCSVELKRKMLSDDLRTKEKQMRDHEDKLLQLVDESDLDRFDAILEQLQLDHTNFLDEKGFLSGVDKTYKRFLQQLQQNQASSSDHSCPVCMRFFKDERELAETIGELKKYTNKLPQKVNDLEVKLKC
jgi:hypothetical protein